MTTPRPPKKDRVVTVRVPEADYQAVKNIAKKRGMTMPAWLRAVFHVAAEGETPEGWPPEMPENEVRAAGGGRKPNESEE